MAPLVPAILRLAIPTSVASFLSYVVSTTTFAFVGHLGREPLAGMALGNMSVVLTGACVISGLLSGMETLCSQAFGAGNLPRVGILFQRGLLICFAWLSVAAMLWIHAEQILLATGQAPSVAFYAAQFCRYYLVAIPAHASCLAVRRFLQSQSVVRPVFWIVLCSAILHPLWCWLLIHRLGLGFIGAPLSSGLTWWLQLLFSFLYILIWRPHKPETWPGWSVECLYGWPEYLRYAFAGTVMVVLEWGSFEALTLFTGRLGTVPLATHSIMGTFTFLYFVCFVGIAVAANVKVGQSLGAGNPHEANRVALWSMLMGFVTGFLLSVLTVLLRRPLIRCYTSDPLVIEQWCKVVWVMLLLAPFAGLQGVGQGVIKGSGRQTFGILMGFIGNFCLGIPLALTFAFWLAKGLMGMWIGMALGNVTTGSLYLLAVYRTDWPRESDRAQLVARARNLQPNGALVEKKEVLSTIPEKCELSTFVANEKEAEQEEGRDETKIRMLVPLSESPCEIES